MSTTDAAGRPTLAPSAVSLAEALAEGSRPWGVASRDLPAFQDAAGAEAACAGLADAADLGARVLLLSAVEAASPGLDPGELAEVRAEADRLGVELHSSLGSVHPHRYDADAVGDLIAAGSTLGVTAYHVTFGVMADRLATSPSWADQLRAGVEPLRGLVDRAERPVVLRTHEEMTTFELVRLADRVDRDALCVGFSPVNVVTRLEDVLSAFERVCDRVAVHFLDDSLLVRTSTGLARRLTTLGDGVVPWEAVLRGTPSHVPAIIDIHQAEFDMPLYEPGWLDHEPDLTPGEIAAVLRWSTGTDIAQVPTEQRRRHSRELLAHAGASRSQRQPEVASS
jgi:sugar phosphate isomerase/epimerase